MVKIFSKITETLTESMVRPKEFEWNIYPTIQYVAAQRRSQKFAVQIGRNTRKFHMKNFEVCQFSMTFLVDQKTMKKNVW